MQAPRLLVSRLGCEDGNAFPALPSGVRFLRVWAQTPLNGLLLACTPGLKSARGPTQSLESKQTPELSNLQGWGAGLGTLRNWVLGPPEAS